MGGGSGVEWYFGYQHPHMDLNCEDWRSRDGMWNQTRNALEFFRAHLPFQEMAPDNSLVEGGNAFVLAHPGHVYAVYMPQGGEPMLKLEAGNYTVEWFNPRSGGSLVRGSVRSVKGPGSASLGRPPADPGQDWTALVKRSPR